MFLRWGGKRGEERKYRYDRKWGVNFSFGHVDCTIAKLCIESTYSVFDIYIHTLVPRKESERSESSRKCFGAKNKPNETFPSQSTVEYEKRPLNHTLRKFLSKLMLLLDPCLSDRFSRDFAEMVSQARSPHRPSFLQM